MRMVTVSPKTWNVIVTGMYIPPFGRQNRLSLAGALGVIRPYSSYQIPRFLSIPAALPPGRKKSLPSQGRWLGEAETERLSRLQKHIPGGDNLSVTLRVPAPLKGEP